MDASVERIVFDFEGFPVAVRAQNGIEDAIQRPAAFVQRTEDHVAARGDDFERGRGGCNVPAGVTLGVLVAGGEVDAALRVEFVQQGLEATVVRDFGDGTADDNAGRCRERVGTHRKAGGNSHYCSVDEMFM